MAVGIIQDSFTCSFTEYPHGDVRGRQTVVRAFADRLVATGMWSIAAETVPTTNFTGSVIYSINLKFKDNDHYIRLQVSGNTNVASDLMSVSFTKAGNLTSSPSGWTSSPTVSITYSTLGYTRLGIYCLFGPTWMIVAPVPYSLSFPQPVATNTSWFGGYQLSDFITPATTVDVMAFSNSSTTPMVSALLGQMFLPGDDLPKSGFTYSLPTSAPTTEIIVPSGAITGTNWRKVDLFGFSNYILAAVGSVLSINGHYFILTSATSIADLGAIP